MTQVITYPLLRWLTCAVFICMAATVSSQEVLREKMFIHTDRNHYHAGDIIWYKVYVVDASNLRPVDISKIAYVEVLDSLNKPALQQIVSLKKGEGGGSVEIPALRAGVYTLRGYTNWMKNFGPATFFQKQIAIANAQSSAKDFEQTSPSAVFLIDERLRTTIRADAREYGTRKKVMINLSAVLSTGQPAQAHLSLSVYKADSLRGRDPADIALYLANSGAQEDAPQLKYAPEYNGHIVTGTITEKKSGQPAAGISVSLTVPGYSSGFYNCLSDAQGNIRFEIKDAIAQDSFIVQTNLVSDDVYNIHINSPFSDEYAAGDERRAFSLVDDSVSLLERSIGAQVQQLYYGAERKIFAKPRADTMPFFGRADVVYQLDDYTRFSKMEEVFREYVGPVAVNRVGGKPQLSMYLMNTHTKMQRSPLVLLNGYPVTDIEKLFAFDPLKVKTIEVVNRRYFRNNDVFDGIVNMVTYSHDLNGFPVNSTATVLKDQNITGGRQFASPAYPDAATAASRMPDFRQVLYWSPAIITDANGNAHIEFYTSDVKGTFIVQVQGITSNGEAGSSFISFEVK